MQNCFIAKNELTGLYRNNVDYKFRVVLDNFLKSGINSLDEYIEWVHQWKAYEKSLVAAIRFFRKMKNESSDNKRYYWSQKIMLKSTATKFYEYRALKKDFFKKSDFFNSARINKSNVKEEELC